MIKKIYKIIKPDDPMTIYIGSSHDLVERLLKHKNNTLDCLVGWFDNTCYLFEIEEREASGKSEFELIEFDWVSKFRKEGYVVLNSNDGRSKAEGYTKSINTKNNTKNKVSGVSKVNNTKHNVKNNAKNNPLKTIEYNYWACNICRKAKKEGLTSKEYRIKHNIPDYTGPKTK